MKQIDLRVSIKFYEDGRTGIDFGPLVPDEFEKQAKHLNAWHNGMIVSLREAVIKWSKIHSRMTKREVRRLERANRRFAKGVGKLREKELAKATVQ